MPVKPDIANKALVAAMSAESDVAPPTRSRSSSFASMVGDLNVGDSPAAKVLKVNPIFSLADALNRMPEESERLRNSVTSSVSQAKRKNRGAEYSIEIANFLSKSGVYLIALVTRTA